MTDELEPLSADVFKALEVERARPAVPADQLARLASRLDATFAPPAAPVTPSAAPASGLAAGVGGVGGKAVLLAVGLALGAVGGAQLQKNFGAPREVVVERVVEKVVEVPVRVEVQVPVEVPVEAPRPPVAELRPKQTEPVRAPVELERLIIEQATAALGRGKGDDALAACAEHAKRFPSGQLVEERESVAIRALVVLGRKDQAIARATEFRAHFPDSLLIDVVNEAVR
jgi:hypothetical protein